METAKQIELSFRYAMLQRSLEGPRQKLFEIERQQQQLHQQQLRYQQQQQQLRCKNDNDEGNNIISYVDSNNNDVCDITKQGEKNEEWNDNMNDNINKKSQRKVVLSTSTLSQKQKQPSSSSLSLSSSTSSTKTKASISTTIPRESACQVPLLAIPREQHSICRRSVDSISSSSTTKTVTEVIVFNKEDKEQGDCGAEKVVRSSSSSSSSTNKKTLDDDDNKDKLVNTIVRLKFPTECDILCGQSSICASHLGNQRLQVVLDMYTVRYNEATSKQERMVITKDIVACIHNTSGRFLKFKNEDGIWEEISNAAACDKVSHALRTKVKHNKKRNGPENNTPRGGGRQQPQPHPKQQQQERNQKQQHHSNQKNHWQLKKN